MVGLSIKLSKRPIRKNYKEKITFTLISHERTKNEQIEHRYMRGNEWEESARYSTIIDERSLKKTFISEESMSDFEVSIFLTSRLYYSSF